MEDVSGLQEYLTENAFLSEEEFSQAQDYALTRNISEEEALLFLEFVSYETLGKFLSTVFKKPYIPLLKKPPSEVTKSCVPLKTAVRLKIFPVKYDSKSKKLAAAVSNPKDPQVVAELRSNLINVSKVSFSVACRAEIEKAIEVFYKGKRLTSDPVLEIPKDFSILPDQGIADRALSLDQTRPSESVMLLEADQARARAMKALLKAEGYDQINWAMSPTDVIKACEGKRPDVLLVNGQRFRPDGPWLTELRGKAELPRITYYEVTPFLQGQEVGYRQMSDALVNAIAFLVRKHLQDKPDRHKETVERVKHCRLVALRMRLSRRVVDGVSLAAWLSAREITAELVTQISTPYKLHEILWPNSSHDQDGRIEATILHTIKRYQAFVKKHPDAERDAARIREALNFESSDSSTTTVIETLLRILKEEEFLDGVDRRSARVLVVDPEAREDSPPLLRLSNEGLDIQIAKTAHDAAEVISSSPVDLILSEMALGDTSGLKLCQVVKNKEGTRTIPFVFLTADKGEKLQAECLEAGADDFLQNPVDPEVLALKVQRILSLRQSAQSTGGVHGSLTEMNSSDLIQSLSAGEKDVEIRLDCRGRQGTIFMQGGEIVHAQTDSLQGDEAFYSLVAWQEGNFNIVSCEDFPARTIHSPLMSMLIEGARRVDEASVN